MMNIKNLNNQELVIDLYNRYYKNDTVSADCVSSHWKKFLPQTDVLIDKDLNILKLKGYGFGDMHHSDPIHRGLDALCNFSYFINSPDKKEISRISKFAKKNIKKLGFYLNYDCFRQICALSLILRHLNTDRKKRMDVLMIGDGYGFLSSLIKSICPESRITLIDLGKVLLFQSVNLQVIHPGAVHSKASETVSSDNVFDFLYIPAEEMGGIKNNIKYDLAINIASMQEMNHKTIENYFEFLRAHLLSNGLFYCCNRESKRLPDGEVINFLKYPWVSEDLHLVDEICPFYKYSFSPRPPFVRYFDGLVRHRLTRMKIDD